MSLDDKIPKCDIEDKEGNESLSINVTKSSILDLRAAIKELKEAIRNAKQVGITPTLRIMDEVFGPALTDNHSPKGSSGFSDEISDLNKSPADSVEEEKR